MIYWPEIRETASVNQLDTTLGSDEPHVICKTYDNKGIYDDWEMNLNNPLQQMQKCHQRW